MACCSRPSASRNWRSGVNLLTALVALATLLSYVVMYTPLKRRTSLSTIVGAIPGALPAVIGWTAATNTLSIEGWALFGIVFMWQMPHFLAIAWMYRDDYARAGIPLLTVIEPDGRSTGRQAVLYAAALVPVSLLPTAVGMATAWYLVGAMALGAILMVLSVEFGDAQHARGAAAVPRDDSLPAAPLDGAADRSLPAPAVIDYAQLPALNASLNGIAAVLLPSAGSSFDAAKCAAAAHACSRPSPPRRCS